MEDIYSKSMQILVDAKISIMRIACQILKNGKGGGEEKHLHQNSQERQEMSRPKPFSTRPIQAPRLAVAGMSGKFPGTIRRVKVVVCLEEDAG